MSVAPTLPQPPEPSDRETDAARRTRQLAMLRRLGELNMQAAEVAAQQVRDQVPASPETPSPALQLARATRAVTLVIALENRVAAGDPAAQALSPLATDPRRRLLRQSLYKAVDSEPDRATRNVLRRQIDDCIDEELAADPDCQGSLGDVILAVSDELGLRLDCSQMPDDFLVPFVPRPPGAENKPVRLVFSAPKPDEPPTQPSAPEPPDIPPKPD